MSKFWDDIVILLIVLIFTFLIYSTIKGGMGLHKYLVIQTIKETVKPEYLK